jgi:twitching motility protein PilT
MIPSPAIRNLIREDKPHQIYSAMQVGQSETFMQTMNQSLYHLLSQGQIAKDEAMARSSDTQELRTMIEKDSATLNDRSSGSSGGSSDGRNRNNQINYT